MNWDEEGVVQRASRSVVEVFCAAPGESFVGGLLPKSVEDVNCLMMGKDVEEAQEFPIDAAGRGPDGKKECFVDVRGRKILAILIHFGASAVVQEQVGYDRSGVANCVENRRAGCSPSSREQ